jgi:hypothetical protein
MTKDEERLEQLEKALGKEREDYTSKILEIVKDIRGMDLLAESQVLMLSYRHMIVDKLATYRVALNKRKNSDLNYRKLRFEYYKTNHDVRLDYREINQFIDSDMAMRTRENELLESQISFFNQCIETLDRMGFSIKNRIQIEELNQKNF